MYRIGVSLILLLHSCIARSTTHSASGDDYAGFVYAGCSRPRCTPGSPCQLNVDSLLASLSSAAAFSSYANFTSSADAASSSPAYGLFQCRGDLLFSDCASCVRSALSRLSSLCPSAADAAVQLRGCFLRYASDSFLGKPDTRVLYKKCGGGPPHGFPDLLAMRDATLGDLSKFGSGRGSYRVGAAGYVQAVAQCAGDQSGKQCDECVTAAVGQLRTACGFAVAGDAYLGKCYARFWTDGVGAPKAEHDDEAEKTVAIIIGVVAGVGLIIVIISFLRSRARNNGKH